MTQGLIFIVCFWWCWSVIKTHIMLLSSLLSLLPPLTRCCSGACSWKPVGNSSRVRGPWSVEKPSPPLVWERAWWLHHPKLEMTHLGDSRRKANKMFLWGYMWLFFSGTLFPTGQPVGKHAAPNSQGTKIKSRSAEQDCRAETGPQSCGREMYSPKMKMCSQERSWCYLDLAHVPAPRKCKVFLGKVIFEKCFSNLLRLFGKRDSAMTPDKSFLVHQ